jgi:hypothetical protein
MMPYVLAWFPMIVIGVGNGILREATYGKHTTELAAHQWSTVIGGVLLVLYMGIVIWFFPLRSVMEALAVGGGWMLATVAFEFVFGRLVAGHSWARLLRDYNLFAGRVWLFIPLGIGAVPYGFYRLFT